MVDWAQLYLFELIFMRMSGFLLFNPLLGRSNLPAMVKTGMALVLSILVFGTAGTGVPQPDTLVELAFRLHHFADGVQFHRAKYILRHVAYSSLLPSL